MRESLRHEGELTLLKAITMDFFQSHGKSSSRRDQLKIQQIIGAKKERASKSIVCCGILSSPLTWVLKYTTAATTSEIWKSSNENCSLWVEEASESKKSATGGVSWSNETLLKWALSSLVVKGRADDFFVEPEIPRCSMVYITCLSGG